jgi:integrase
LKPSGKPYWRSLDAHLHIGYRRGLHSGKWCYRRYEKVSKSYVVETLPGVADDKADADGISVLNFHQAQDKVRKRYAKHQQKGVAVGFTINDALDQYKADLEKRSGDPANVSRVRQHIGDLGNASVVDVEATRYRRWRDGLTIKPASVNRTCAALVAALNLAAELDKKGIAPHREEWRSGLQAIANAEQTRNVILPDPLIRRLVELAAGEGDEFALYVEVHAVTGARTSQIARLEVKDLQDRRDNPRLLMPVSRKGCAQKAVTHRPVPITGTLAAKLRAVVNGRAMTDLLLLKASGEPWKKSDHAEPFKRVAGIAGLDAAVSIYALRHSSIVRQLLAGVPARLVAAAHDTSIAMLEKTYSAHIDDHGDAMLRAALLDVSKPAPALTVVGRP